MFVKHSLTNVRRSWKKSLLFFCLILALVIIMCISVSLISIINTFLKTSAENYKSIGVFEYMGASYPDETTYDPRIEQARDALDMNKISNHPATLSWDANAAAFGYIDTKESLNKGARSAGILVVSIDAFQGAKEGYRAIIVEHLYTTRSNTDGIMIYIDSSGLKLERGRYYLIHGEFYRGQTSYTYFKITPFVNKVAEELGFDGSLENMLMDITVADKEYRIPENTHFHAMAKNYGVTNNSLTVRASFDLSLLHEFQQGKLYLREGRFPTAEEYFSGASVCLLPEKIAKSLGKNVGDKITLSVALKEHAAQYDSYWEGEGFDFSDEYKIVGIINTYDIYAENVYIPKTENIDFSINTFSYKLGQVLLENSKINEFVDDVMPTLPERVRLTVYDQGYGIISQSLSDILLIAKIILTICLVVGAAIIALFGFLFIYRQKDSAKIMRRLGAKKSDIYTYYLFGSGSIALFASVAGAVISILLSGFIMEMVRLSVSGYVNNYSLYSSSNLSIIKPIIFASNADISLFLMVGVLTFFAALLSAFVFSALCIKSHKNRHRAILLPLKTRSSSLKGGVYKYAWLSIKRGFSRTAIPIIVTACIIVMFFQLINIGFVYEKKLQDLKENTSIQGTFIDIKGQKTDGIVVDGLSINEIYRSGMTSNIVLTEHTNFIYRGILYHNDVWTGLPEFQMPGTSFAYETLVNTIQSGPKVIFTNNFEKSPEFYYGSKVTTEFLPGYDLSLFEGTEFDLPDGCLVSTEFISAHGIELGDVIELLVYTNEIYTFKIRVIGSFVKAGIQDNIYMPLRYASPFERVFEDEPQDTLKYIQFESARFVVQNGDELDAFKQYLSEKGYSEISKIHDKRSFIMLEDKDFLRSVSAMSQRIWYMDATFPLIYAIALALGGLIPYILIQLRKREIAIMRAQGASKGISFMSMFIEQFVLSFLGLALGLTAWVLLGNPISTLGIILTAVYFAAWLIGASISVKKINEYSVQSILKAEE